MTAPGRTIVSFAADTDLHRDLQTMATAANRTIADEIETRLMALRLIEEAMRILKRPDLRAEQGPKSGT